VGVVLIHFEMLPYRILILVIFIYLIISCLMMMSVDQTMLHRVIE
jgi:hypothetical protein